MSIGYLTPESVLLIISHWIPCCVQQTVWMGRSHPGRWMRYRRGRYRRGRKSSGIKYLQKCEGNGAQSKSGEVNPKQEGILK